MQKEIELSVHPDYIFDNEYIKRKSAEKSKMNISDITLMRVVRRSIDARKAPVYKLKVVLYVGEDPLPESYQFEFKDVRKSKKVLIIGSGPAGLFAALRLIELGIKPVIFERGKDVKARRWDLKAIQRDHIVNPDSNYCFGEGGAGTYSDGKLYTRSKKRGNVKRILELLSIHGAQREILIDAHPHIGSNRLPKVVQNIRETIIKYGGEIKFNSKVTDLVIAKGKAIGVVVNSSEEVLGEAVIVAVGHSARDIYYMLDRRGVLLEPKEFAMGVRIEHPQKLIDTIQYHSPKRHVNLPASSYNLSCQVEQRGVYSFCMCPGGIIIPASTAPEELVLNGMSVSKRNSPFANSGLVVSIMGSDWEHFREHGKFAGLEFQKHVERLAFEAGGSKQSAPAQRITDFVAGRMSQSLPETSYIPGTVIAPLHEILPENIVKRLQRALIQFGKKMHGYFTEEGQILAAETRTSSPLRIPRDSESFVNYQIAGLFPAGEGAGYAGGIVSAAIDGEKCAEGASKYVFGT